MATADQRFSEPSPRTPERQALQVAIESLVAARKRAAALDEVAEEQEAAKVKEALALAESRHREALEAVVKADPALRALIEAFEKAQERANELHAALAVLGPVMMPADYLIQGVPRCDFAYSAKPSQRAAAAWRSALEKLAGDADAELPRDDARGAPKA